MKDYLDDKTRVTVKFYFPALGYVIALQRKKWYGWKTVAWNYPSVLQNYSYEYVVYWLKWSESNDDNSLFSNERKIGNKLIAGKK